MTMITNTTTKFFWATIQKNFSFGISKEKVLLLGSLMLFIACHNKQNLNLVSLKTPTGWGYVITNNGKIIIKQTVIPVISENKSFYTEEEALKVGNLVLQKLKADLSPTVTRNELIVLAIKT